MADIEERAEEWARERIAGSLGVDDLIAAYLAGSEQTRADYAAHEQNMQNWRDLAGCTRCECSCGAR